MTIITGSFDTVSSQYGFDAEDVVPFMMLPSLNSLTAGALSVEEGEDDWLQIGVTAEDEDAEEENEDDDANNDDDNERTEFPHPRLPSNNDHTTKAIKTSSGYTLPPKSSTIKHINLVKSLVSCSVLSRVLRLPIALESFRYEVSGPSVGYWPFVAADLLPGLLLQANSLRELKITTQEAEDLGEDEPVIGSLSGLQVLERLALPALVLLGSPPDSLDSNRVVRRNPLDDLLPPRLVTLELYLEGAWDLAQLLNVTGLPKNLSQTSQRIPSLRKIVVQGSRSLEPRTREEVLEQSRRLSPMIDLIIQ